MIPLAMKDLEQEITELFVDTKAPVCITFDGASRDGEVVALTMRTVSTEFRVVQKVIEVRILKKSMDHKSLSRLLLRCISERYRMLSNQILYFQHD